MILIPISNTRALSIAPPSGYAGFNNNDSEGHIMKMPIALILSLSCISACGGTGGQANDVSPRSHDSQSHEPQSDKPESLLVASSKAVCQGMMQQLCLQVRESNGQNHEFLYDGIAGFEFIWGHSYQLQIATESRKGAPQDAAAIGRRLVKVLGEKEDPVGAQYTYSGVVLNPYTVTFDQGEYRFLGQAFVCREQKTCEALAIAHKTVPRADLVFSYLGNGDIQLVSWNRAD
jgi:hypothetical protein